MTNTTSRSNESAPTVDVEPPAASRRTSAGGAQAGAARAEGAPEDGARASGAQVVGEPGSVMGEAPTVTDAVARNVREARTERGWTLDQLANRSGVSKGMVVQIERGSTNPSIGTLSKISEALGVSLADLVDAGDVPNVRVVEAGDVAELWNTPAGSAARLLVGGRRPDFIELWEWVLAPGDEYVGRPHPSGIRELLHVEEGELILVVGDDTIVLPAGTSAAYDGDQPHIYRNEGDARVRIVLVMVDPSGSRADEG